MCISQRKARLAFVIVSSGLWLIDNAAVSVSVKRPAGGFLHCRGFFGFCLWGHFSSRISFLPSWPSPSLHCAGCFLHTHTHTEDICPSGNGSIALGILHNKPPASGCRSDSGSHMMPSLSALLLWSVPQLCTTLNQKVSLARLVTDHETHLMWFLMNCSRLFGPVCGPSVPPWGFRSKFQRYAILVLNFAFLYSRATSNQSCPPRRDGKSHFCPNYLIKNSNGSYTSVTGSSCLVCRHPLRVWPFFSPNSIASTTDSLIPPKNIS